MPAMPPRLAAPLASEACAALLALVLALGAGTPARAQAQAERQVDLQLVLAVDVSGSVSEERFRLQQQGYAAAFRNWRVIQAIRSGAAQAIAVTVTQWTGPGQQVQVVPWTVISDEASASSFADAIARSTRELYGGGTSISGAIDHARELFPSSGVKGGRRVIDISGDGSNNRGRPAEQARDEAVRSGLVINGLPILALEAGLDKYYEVHVIGGPRAFIIPAKTYETFAEAVLRKLITEIVWMGLERAEVGAGAE